MKRYSKYDKNKLMGVIFQLAKLNNYSLAAFEFAIQFYILCGDNCFINVQINYFPESLVKYVFGKEYSILLKKTRYPYEQSQNIKDKIQRHQTLIDNILIVYNELKRDWFSNGGKSRMDDIKKAILFIPLSRICYFTNHNKISTLEFSKHNSSAASA